MENTLVQGGRLRKTNRGIISFAPFLAGASMLALGALLATASPAKAGSCDTETKPDVERVCAGVPGTDRRGRQMADGAVVLSMDGQQNKATSISFKDNGMPFGLNVLRDAGFLITGNANSGTVTIELTGTGDITAGGDDNAPASGLATLNGDAIFIDHKGNGDIDIDAIANLQSAKGSGVQVRSEHASHTADTTVTITGNIGASGANEANAVGKDGIYIFQNKAGSAVVEVTGDIWAGRESSFRLDRAGSTTVMKAGRGIYIRQEHSSGQDARVTIRGDGSSNGAIRSRGTGISVYNKGAGTTSVLAGGDIQSFGDGAGIDVTTHSNSTEHSAKISAKTVITKEGVGINLKHFGGRAGRVEVSGSVTSGMSEGIIVKADGQGGTGGMTPDALATHLSVKVGTAETEAQRSQAARADSVRSGKDGISITHNGGNADEAMAVATADVRSYAYINATNSMSGTEATGIKIAMGENTGSASIMQEDDIFADSPATTEITGVTVRVLAQEEINAKTRGIDINQQGTGAIRIQTSCTADSTTTADSCITTAGEEGIRVQTATKTTGTIDITVAGEADRADMTGTNRAIKSEGTGILLHQFGDDDATVTVNGIIETAAGHGVQINRDDGGGDATIAVNADITATGGSGIDVHFIHDTSTTTTGNVSVTIAEGVTVTADSNPAINVGNFGSGDATVTVNGTVRRTTTGSSGTVISLRGGSSGNVRLVLGDGADVGEGRSSDNRDIEVEAASSTIELTGTREGKTLDLGRIGGNPGTGGTGFGTLEKTGTGTWTLTGAQGDEQVFNRLMVSNGTLVLDLDPPDGGGVPGLQFTGDEPMLFIAQGANLEVRGDMLSAQSVTLDLNDDLFLSGANGRIDVGGLDAGPDASLTIEVEFPEAMEPMEPMEPMDGTDGTDGTDGMEEEGVVLAQARLSTGSGGVNAAEDISVNIVPVATGGPPVRIGNFIRVGGTASQGASTFVAHNTVDSPVQFFLEHEEVEGANVWNLVPRQAGPGGGTGTIHDALAAVLSELSQPEMLYQRLRDRKAKRGTNSWVKAYSDSKQFTPSGPGFDIESTGFQIGLRGPLKKLFHQEWVRDASFDASIEFGSASTDASVGAGTVQIETETFEVGLGTTYNLNRFYVDGQIGYSYFGNTLDAGGTRLASPDATSLSASIEFGSVLGGKGVPFVPVDENAPDGPVLPDVELVPSLQISWSSVDFDPYTSTTGIPVRLDDGGVLFARIGMLALGKWGDIRLFHEDFPVADVRLRGHTNIVMPLAAEVATEVMGMSMTSERADLSLDAGIGIDYEWDDAYVLYADLSTQYGGEVEGYSGSIGFKYEF